MHVFIYMCVRIYIYIYIYFRDMCICGYVYMCSFKHSTTIKDTPPNKKVFIIHF